MMLPISTKRFSLSTCTLGFGLILWTPLLAHADPGPTLTVDARVGHHLISNDIYGMNDNPWDAGLGKEIALPVSRWGGDATTRYNWQTDATNSGGDWYFMAGGGKSGTVVPGASSDAFVDKIKTAGGKALLTIPVIDYINSVNASDWNCSFPVSIFGQQKDHNPYIHPVINGQQTDAGNGQKPDGTNIVLTLDQILRVHVPNTPDIQKAWIKHLMGKYGSASQGGVAIYEMDNEPSGWANTHRDIHPIQPTYKEIVDKTLPYARMVKAADPTALTDGPGDFGWAVYNAGADKKGGVGNAQYYLSRMQQESELTGKRLLDYFDEHYYPFPQTDENDAIRIESTRSLWDSSYIEKNWIGQYGGSIRLIRRMHEWVDKYYPGTKLAITEYNWNLGGQQSIVDAVVEADVLGIFGRERLDMATLWSTPKPDDPVAYAFRMYRNYDGKGSKFGSLGIQSTSADQGRLAMYGAIRQVDGALTLIVINKTETPLTSTLALSHFTPSGKAHVYRYSADNLQQIVPVADQIAGPAGFTATYPSRSVTLVVIPGRQM